MAERCMTALQVRNRTLAELQQDVSSEQARDIEETFFRQHAELKDIGEEYKGMAALSRKLVQIQDQCIQSHLPALQKEVVITNQQCLNDIAINGYMLHSSRQLHLCTAHTAPMQLHEMYCFVSAAADVFAH